MQATQEWGWGEKQMSQKGVVIVKVRDDMVYVREEAINVMKTGWILI